MIVSFLLKNQIIKRTDSNTVVAQSKNYLRAKFITLTDDWNGPITAIFGDYTVILDENNECVVPWEVLQNPGTVKVSAFCGDLHTASVATMVVNPSGYVDGQTPEPPTPDVYQTLVQTANNAKNIAQSVRDDADAGLFDGEPGAAGKDGFSPVATVQQTTGGATITITDKTGTTTANIYNGRDGADGVSPIATVEQADDGVVITITDKSGTTTATAHNGRDGTDGVDGLNAPQIDDTQASPANPWSGAKTAAELEGYAPVESAIRPTANGNTAVCSDSAAWAFQGLKVYGKSTQDGTPSPESPVPIVSVGNDGNVELDVTGKNLLYAKTIDSVDYDPYQSQSLILSTPNGLPGIPVDSGGNYTDENGQQWVCDEIDLARGKYVHRVGTETINGGYNFLETSDVPGRFAQYLMFTNLYKDGEHDSICNIALWGRWGVSKDNTAWKFAISKTDSYLNPPTASGITTADELNAFLSNLDYPLVFAGQLATPIETDLPAEEIAAYKALHTYFGTTVVSTAEPVAGIEARYVADGTNYLQSVVDRIAALESAATNI